MTTYHVGQRVEATFPFTCSPLVEGRVVSVPGPGLVGVRFSDTGFTYVFPESRLRPLGDAADTPVVVTSADGAV